VAVVEAQVAPVAEVVAQVAPVAVLAVVRAQAWRESRHRRSR